MQIDLFKLKLKNLKWLQWKPVPVVHDTTKKIGFVKGKTV